MLVESRHVFLSSEQSGTRTEGKGSVILKEHLGLLQNKENSKSSPFLTSLDKLFRL